MAIRIMAVIEATVTTNTIITIIKDKIVAAAVVRCIIMARSIIITIIIARPIKITIIITRPITVTVIAARPAIIILTITIDKVKWLISSFRVVEQFQYITEFRVAKA